MTSFLFSPADTQDLSTGVFYAHIVSTEPSLFSNNVSQINITDAIGYVPYTLTGLTFNTLKWTFNNFTFPTYNYVTSPCGIVICKQLGVSPVSTDPIIYYTSLDNVINQTVVFPTGKYTLNVSFPAQGIIVYKQYYNYTSGSYVATEPVPKGLIYLLGTRNETQSFVSPLANSITGTHSANNTAINYLFDRTLNNDSTNGQTYVGLNFGSRRIKVGTIGLRSPIAQSGVAWQVWGSNTATGINLTNINNAGLWTLLCTTNAITAGFNFATATNQTYWQYLKLSTVSNNSGLIEELEFYNSSMYSTDENLMSTIIDSPFQNNILDQAGYNIWTTTSGFILDNAAYIGSKFISSTSPLFALGSRNFKLSLDFKYSNLGVSSTLRANPDTNINNILHLATDSSGRISLGLGTGGAQFYNTGLLGTVSTTTFDTITCSRVSGLITTTFNTNTVTTVNGSAIPSSRFDLEAIGSYVRNFKLIT